MTNILNNIENADFLGQTQMDLVDLEVESALERFGANASTDHVDYLYDSEVTSMFKGQKQ